MLADLVEPVKLTLRMTRLAISVSLTRPLSPCTSCATPSGMPASASARNNSLLQPGRFLRRARDHRAAGGERGADLLGQEVDREIPRREGRDRADRLADHSADAGRPGGPECGHSRAWRPRRTSRTIGPSRATSGLASSSGLPCSWVRVAAIWSARSRSRSAVLWRIARALLDVGRAPFGPGALRGGERLVEVGLGGVGHVGDRLRVDRVDDAMAVAAFAAFPCAVDEELEVCFISHGAGR